MFAVDSENFGDMAVLECEGRLVRSDAAFMLRDAVMSQQDAGIVVLDLSEVSAIEGGGLGMLVFLQRWAYDQDIALKLFNPCLAVRERLERADSMRAFDVVTLDEMMALLDQGDGPEALAS
jgi:ABC-type transporter Mla MlaB component